MIYRLKTSSEKEWAKGYFYDAGSAYYKIIVRACSVPYARLVAAKHAGDEGSAAWMDSSTIVEDVSHGTEEFLGVL